MSKYFIGLMTGTSADSIDGCVVDFSNGFELIHSKSNNLEKNYKSKYEEAIKKGFKNKEDDEILLEKDEPPSESAPIIDEIYDSRENNSNWLKNDLSNKTKIKKYLIFSEILTIMKKIKRKRETCCHFSGFRARREARLISQFRYYSSSRA